MARIRSITFALAWAFILAPWLTAFAENADAPVAVGAQLAQDANGAELTFDLSRAVDARAYALASPDRIVVDLPEVNFQLGSSVGRADPGASAAIVKAFRFGLLALGKSRIVIDLVRPACPAEVESKPIVSGAPASRLKVVLRPCDGASFAALERSPDSSPGPLAPLPPVTEPVIVLDPGHGGADGGAHGVGGVLEKTLVLAFCVELKRQLEATKRYAIVMTREDDQYVDLDDRVTIAREANASLFVSVHADILSEAADVSGSTVYTVADRASDAEAARIAARENAADPAPGKVRSAQDDPEVADILFDLKRRETRAYAHIFSRGLVDSLRGVTRLNHNPERSAGFVVLKAPEFPSVLVELGYLSNPQDVQAMTSADWRANTAAAMVKAIDAFFAGSVGTGDAAASEPGAVLQGPQTKAPHQ